MTWSMAQQEAFLRLCCCCHESCRSPSIDLLSGTTHPAKGCSMHTFLGETSSTNTTGLLSGIHRTFAVFCLLSSCRFGLSPKRVGKRQIGRRIYLINERSGTTAGRIFETELLAQPGAAPAAVRRFDTGRLMEQLLMQSGDGAIP